MNPNNTKHLKTRLLFVAIVILLFTILSFLFITPNQRSCLGNPYVLPFMFLGIPSLYIIAVLDIIYLTIIKKVNLFKILANVSIGGILLLSIYLL